MRTATGSAKWLTLNSFSSTADAIATIKNQGCSIYASDLNPNSKDVRDLDWKNAGPICICMGNEEDGISEELRLHADETFTLPMVGFAESFNLSVATAITLAYISAASGSTDHKKGGPIWPWNMESHEQNCLRLKWLLNSLPQRKMGRALLRRVGIDLPSAINLL
jgi:tRNA(Leu) C34 or U34 (ribose-2'-O)-methylase TrmL